MSMKSLLITISQSSILITEITYKNTIGSTLKMNERTHFTTREHGLGELQDQATSLLLVFVVRVGHIIEARVVAEERSDLFVLLVCEWL